MAPFLDCLGWATGYGHQEGLLGHCGGLVVYCLRDCLGDCRGPAVLPQGQVVVARHHHHHLHLHRHHHRWHHRRPQDGMWSHRHHHHRGRQVEYDFNLQK